MRTIAVEEHFLIPEKEVKVPYPPKMYKALVDLGDGRLADMDAAGIDVQVLQFAGIGIQNMEKEQGNSVARESNDFLAEVVRTHPERFAGFAQLALKDPRSSAYEMERCVTKLGFKGAVWSGTCDGAFLDNPNIRPVLEEAERLRIPIYLHPGMPLPEVIKAYYSGLPENVGMTLATIGWGWHAEIALHSIRLVASGIFDLFPNLQFIIGHLGEFLPVALARTIESMKPVTTHLERPFEDYFHSNFYLSTSGYFAVQPLLCALTVFGADRLLFAVDYPFASNQEGRNFLNSAPLCPEDIAKIAHKNADKLLKI